MPPKAHVGHVGPAVRPVLKVRQGPKARQGRKEQPALRVPQAPKALQAGSRHPILCGSSGTRRRCAL
jgi:hypothetical protein